MNEVEIEKRIEREIKRIKKIQDRLKKEYVKKYIG